jgi:hypothetical protein
MIVLYKPVSSPRYHHISHLKKLAFPWVAAGRF